MVKSRAPSGGFGPGAKTVKLRPHIDLSEDQISEIRKLRRKSGISIKELSTLFKVDEEVIRLSLSAMRTPVAVHRRRTLNVGINAYNFIENERLSNEPYWQTVDRLLTELENSRSHKNRRSRRQFY